MERAGRHRCLYSCAPMGEPTRFVSTDGNVLIVADELIVELFHRLFQNSMRVPCEWVGVKVTPRKHEQINVQFGLASSPGEPVYGEEVSQPFRPIGFDLPAADEPALRAFFSEVAARCGRG